MPTAFVTAPTGAAADIARALVEERLAACVNRFPCRSTYRWNGEIHGDDEEILLAKTVADACPELAQRVRELHPYETPCIERFEESAVDAEFARWRRDAVASSPRSRD